MTDLTLANLGCAAPSRTAWRYAGSVESIFVDPGCSTLIPSENLPGEQAIAVRQCRRGCLGFLDLSIEQLVEGSDQLPWGTLLDDVSHFVGETY